MYYIWALLITIMLFAILQYKEYNKNKKSYLLLTAHNIALFFILYVICLIMFYFIFTIDYKCINKIQQKGGNDIKEINPIIFKRINEDIYTGFTPLDDNVL